MAGPSIFAGILILSTLGCSTADDEAIYKQLAQNLGQAVLDQQAFVQRNINLTNPGFFAGITLQNERDNVELRKLLDEGFTPAVGAECLALNTQLLFNIEKSRENANTSINETGLEGEAKKILEDLGGAINNILIAGTAVIDDVNPGQYKALAIKLAKDYMAVRKLVDDKDASGNCVEVSKALANDLVAFEQSVVDVPSGYHG